MGVIWLIRVLTRGCHEFNGLFANLGNHWKTYREKKEHGLHFTRMEDNEKKTKGGPTWRVQEKSDKLEGVCVNMCVCVCVCVNLMEV